MPAPTQNERVRASKLRKRRSDGKKLSDADRIWLAAYERAHGTGRKRAAAPELAPPPVVRGPQLALDAPATGAHVHETEPEGERVEAATWVPTMPVADEGDEAAPPPEPGVPPPPAAGSPLVDDADAATPGDPAAAQQFAALVRFFTLIGLRAGRELAADIELPDEVRAVIASDDLVVGALDHVGAAAERVALKYGFRSVPMADEAIVAAALVGSGVAVVKNMKRKQLTQRAPSANAGAPKQPEPKREPEQTALDALWR